MKPEVYKKHSDEVRVLEIDCSPSVPSGSTIAQATVAVTDDTEVDGDSLIASYTGKLGNKIYVQISSGEDKCSYNLEVKLSLSNGEIIIDNLRIDVSDSDTIP
jgi:hypothetical protein